MMQSEDFKSDEEAFPLFSTLCCATTLLALICKVAVTSLQSF